MAAFEALLIDWGGVMSIPTLPLLQAGCRERGLDVDEFLDLSRVPGESQELFHAFERGEISSEEFHRRLEAFTGIWLDDVNDLFPGFAPEPRMYAAVARVREQGIPTALVSNSWGLDLYERDLFATTFDEVLISGELGVRKPEPEIYALAAQRVGVAPEACLFVDDSRVNFPPALDLGMTVLHHVDAASTIAELERRFDLRLEG